MREFWLNVHRYPDGSLRYEAFLDRAQAEGDARRWFQLCLPRPRYRLRIIPKAAQPAEA